MIVYIQLQFIVPLFLTWAMTWFVKEVLITKLGCPCAQAKLTTLPFPRTTTFFPEEFHSELICSLVLVLCSVNISVLRDSNY